MSPKQYTTTFNPVARQTESRAAVDTEVSGALWCTELLRSFHLLVESPNGSALSHTLGPQKDSELWHSWTTSKPRKARIWPLRCLVL